MKLTPYVHVFARPAQGAIFRHVLLALVLLTMLLGPATPTLVSADVNPPSFLFSWGTAGTGDGQFNQPRGLAVDSWGNVYVVDTYNYRVQKFDADGEFITEWGSQGTGTDQFVLPFDVAVDSAGDVYVSDYHNHCIRKYRDSGDNVYGCVDTIGTPGTYGSGDEVFNLPWGLAVDADDNLYVADNYNHRIQKFDSSGTFITKWGIADSNDASAGGRFENPTEVAVDSSGNVYVADKNNYRVQKFVWNPTLGDSGEYEFLTMWGVSSGGLYGLEVDSLGNVYVTDNANDLIRKYDGSGTLLSMWGNSGSCESCLDQPFGIAVNDGGDVYVADLSNNRIQVFGEATPWMTFLGGGGYEIFDEARGIAVDSEGYVYVIGVAGSAWTDATDPAPKRTFSGASGAYDAFVARLFPDGRLDWYTFLGSESQDQGYGIALDNNGSVFVTGRSDASWSDAATPVRGHSVSWDAFVAELDADDGDLVWHTFLGGPGDDLGGSIAVDGSGNIFVAGISEAAWAESPARGYSSGKDVFAAALSPGGALVWHTFLGGNGDECYYSLCGIAVDTSGVVVVGDSVADWGSSPVREYSGGRDAFAARLDADDGDLLSHTFLGGPDGSNGDWGHNVAVDGDGAVYVTGKSDASWGTGPVLPHPGGNTAYAAKLSSALELIWHTFLGAGECSGQAVAVDSSGNVYLAGGSWGTWGEPEQPYTGQFDVFAAKLSSTGSLLWNTFAGSGGDEGAFSLALGGDGLLHIAGYANNTWGQPVRAYTSWTDGLVLQLAVPTSTTVDVDLVLTAGWNMVSVPLTLDPEQDGPFQVFTGAVAVYTWDPVLKSYGVPAAIQPEVGYWVAVITDKTIKVTGTPKTTWPGSLITGWNMVGSVYGTAVSVNDADAFDVDPSGSVLTNAIYWWDPEGKSYVAETSIVKGQGYWMAATADCTLTMTAPPPP